MVAPSDDYDYQRQKHYYRYLLVVALAALMGGTIFYHLVQKLSWVDAYYFSVITLSTVGYGDITPHTALEKMFTTFYIFIGVGILATFLSVSMNRRMQRRVVRKERRTMRKQVPSNTADKQKQTGP